MRTNANRRRREKHIARIKFLKIKNLTIEPQSTGYYFDGMRPARIGDMALIYLRKPSFDYGSLRSLMPVRVILLADESGRRWLVQCR